METSRCSLFKYFLILVAEMEDPIFCIVNDRTRSYSEYMYIPMMISTILEIVSKY